MSVGDVGDVRLAVKRQHMVFAERVQLDVLHEHHLFVLFAERRGADDFERILFVSLRQERHRLGDAFGGFQKSFARRVLPQQPQDFGVMELQRLDGPGVETFLFVVSSLFHWRAKIDKVACKSKRVFFRVAPVCRIETLFPGGM